MKYDNIENFNQDAKQDVQTILLNDVCLTKNANFEANKVCAKRVLKKEK